MKHLTFKTVSLLPLGSGKCKSETHAWLHKNIRHQSDWSKVSLYLSPSILSKNQLAKEGPNSVAPVVIPALAPSLDKSLKGDRSLCPVRALRYYLDRTTDLGQLRVVLCLLQERFRQRHLTCHHLPMDQTDCDPMSSLIRRPSLCIRLKPMMSGPLLPLRPSNQGSPESSFFVSLPL